MAASPRRLPIIAAVAVLITALVGAGLFWFSADERHDDAVGDLARAAVGCETTLDFARTGNFYVYLETSGTIREVAGDCSAEPGPFERPRGDRPDVDLVLTGPDGAAVEIVASDGIAYDVDPFRGVQIGELTIDTVGAHRLAVSSGEVAFAIAVGGDPDDGTDVLRGAAMVVLIAGLLVAGGLFVFAARQTASRSGQPTVERGAGGAPPAGPWSDVSSSSPPTGPPLLPPAHARPPAPPRPPAAPPGGAEPQGSPWAPPTPRSD